MGDVHGRLQLVGFVAEKDRLWHFRQQLLWDVRDCAAAGTQEAKGVDRHVEHLVARAADDLQVLRRVDGVAEPASTSDGADGVRQDMPAALADDLTEKHVPLLALFLRSM